MVRTLSRRDFLKQAASTALAVSPIATAVGGLLGAPSESAAAWVCNVPSRNPHGPSKLGFHVTQSNPMDGFIQQLRDNNAYFALIKCASHFGAAFAAKKYTPQTVTVGRYVHPDSEAFADSGDPLREAEEKMKTHMKVWAKNRDVIDYWEVLNECDPIGVEGHRRLGEFYMKCMEIAEKNGYKLALFSYSVGVPEWQEFEALVKMGVFQMAKAGGHILSLHEYNWCSQCRFFGVPLAGHPAYPDRGTLTGRYRWWYEDFLIPEGTVIPLAITESGYGPIAVSPEYPADWDWHAHYMDGGGVGMPWMDDRLREDDYVIGTALFTAGAWDPEGKWVWNTTEIQTITNYVISKRNG